MMKTNKLTMWLMAGALASVAVACGGTTTTGTTGGGGGTTAGGSSSANNGNRGGGSSDSTSGGSIATPVIRPDGTVVIGPGFVPTPIIMAGTAGGPTDASSMGGVVASGYGCIGMMPTAPQHVIEVTAPIAHLRIVVDTYVAGPGGSNDTTLYVRVPGGTVWCDDDGGGDLQPMVEGAVMPGRVEIFVGGYSTSGVGARYKIAFTEASDYTHYSIRGTAPPAYGY